jgi:hypothetical protein
MGFKNMTHFKQLTCYAIPFLVITYLRQLQEYFFLVKDEDFFKEGMYAAIPSRERGSTTANNIWMSKSKDKNKNRDVRVTSLAFFQPKKMVNDVCVTLREWAAFIFKCEFEPKSLDASSEEILNCKSLRQKQYNMLGNNLTWGKLHAEEKSNNTARTAIEVSTMDEKELYLNVCEALRANASKTTKKHD